jgi:maltose O-acetyltransferase
MTMNLIKKSLTIAHYEVNQFHPRLRLVNLLSALLPIYVGSRIRTQLLRLAGFRLGSGTLIFGTPTLTGTGNIYEKLIIGRECLVSWGCYLDLQGTITIGDRVGFSPQITVLTSSHEIGSPYNRVGELVALPVRIEDGAWLGARCTILPGVTIHQGAVIAAGTIVTKDVPAHTVVGGVPGRVLRHLNGHQPISDMEPNLEELGIPKNNHQVSPVDV